jgi:hypothetical protein
MRLLIDKETIHSEMYFTLCSPCLQSSQLGIFSNFLPKDGDINQKLVSLQMKSELKQQDYGIRRD